MAGCDGDLGELRDERGGKGGREGRREGGRAAYLFTAAQCAAVRGLDWSGC